MNMINIVKELEQVKESQEPRPAANFTVEWLNNQAIGYFGAEKFTKIYLAKDRTYMTDRCWPSQRIPIDKIREPEKCVSSWKIVAAYNNPRGGDFIVYDNGYISDLHYATRLGRLHKLS